MKSDCERRDHQDVRGGPTLSLTWLCFVFPSSSLWADLAGAERRLQELAEIEVALVLLA